MENMYIEELKSSVNLLMANLESMPVSKGGEFKLQKLKRSHNASIIDMGEESENQLSKSDVLLSFSLEVKSLKSLKVYWCIHRKYTMPLARNHIAPKEVQSIGPPVKCNFVVFPCLKAVLKDSGKIFRSLH